MLFFPKGGTFTTTSGLYPGNNSLTNSTGFNSTQQVAVHFLLLLPNLEIFMKHAYSICYISSVTRSNVNHSGCQKLCTQDYLLYLLQRKCIMPQRKGRRRKKTHKTDRCPDVGQNRHVFAFMFWNLHCKVATLAQGTSHITLPNFSATFCLSPPFRSKSPLLNHIVHICLYLSLSLYLTYHFPTLSV